MKRMRAASVIATAFTVMLLLLAVPPSASAVTSGELIENPKLWDGRTVSFVGESIGEIMVRGDIAWLHVNDDAYAKKSIESGGVRSGYNSGMAVVLPASEATGVEHFGSYSEQGDVVEVTGVFRAASSRYGGEMVIEGQSVRVVDPGYAVDHPVDGRKLWAIAILAPVCLGAGMLLRRRDGRAPSVLRGLLSRDGRGAR